MGLPLASPQWVWCSFVSLRHRHYWLLYRGWRWEWQIWRGLVIYPQIVWPSKHSLNRSLQGREERYQRCSNLWQVSQEVSRRSFHPWVSKPAKGRTGRHLAILSSRRLSWPAGGKTWNFHRIGSLPWLCRVGIEAPDTSHFASGPSLY